MFEFLVSPGGVIGALLGLSVAALLNWVFPSLAEHATVLYAALVAGGFLVGVILDAGSSKK
jgi:H+/Cl- antiporter ClcA